MKVTNKARALRGVHFDGHLRWIKPGETIEGEMTAAERKRADAADGIEVEGDATLPDKDESGNVVATAELVAGDSLHDTVTERDATIAARDATIADLHTQMTMANEAVAAAQADAKAKDATIVDLTAKLAAATKKP